ncbi:MAG: hypothetical protein EHM49_03735, partial [Deltaproteobacteria bacterium]
MHPLLEHLSSQEAQRRQRLEEARRAVETNPMQLQNALAEGLKTSVPAGSKIATKKFPTKLEAVEHAIPKDDPRSKLGTATWSRYKSMMQDPKYENFHPKDLLRVASEVESSLITEPLHKYAQEQHTGLWHSMFPGDVAPVPGQEEWEKAHPIEPIEHTGVLESAAYGAGGLAAWEAGKVALGKGAAAKPKYKVDPRSAAITTREVPKVGRLGALKALGRFGPWGKLAAAGAVAVPSFYVFDEASQRSTRSLLETEWGAKHPNLSAMTGLAVGLAASAPIAFEGIFGDVLEKKLIHKETFSRIKDKLLDRDITAKRLNTFPTAKNIMLLRSIEKELLKDTEDIGRAIQKDRDKVVTNLIDIISKRVEEKRFGTPALPAPGAPTSPAGEAIPISGRLLGEGMTSGPASGLEIPGRAIPLGGRTGVPTTRPEGPIQPYTGLKYLGEGKYTAGDIKTQEGLDRVLEEISLGKTKDEAVQLVGEMENGIERRFTVKEKVTPTIGPRLRASLKELGYEDKEIDFLKYDKAVWLRDTTKAIAKSTERKKVVGNILESDVGVKKSKIDVSGLTQEEKQLQWARTLSPQRRYDAVSKGILSEDINRKITLEQKSKVEKGEEYETFWKSVKEEEDAALESLGGMDRTILSTEGEVKTFDLDSYEKAKKTFVERMMAGKAAPIAGTAA